ncbi:SusC/RagA family TonB-linked outer membrane protein [Algoriphagus terrigena]|uniref:SusC/RagA family TonB-linked outer membrane protein n=1 Tax=Algoriphagus terrigena TaxID=344884 RepID=UPI00041F4E5F|nr:SusC/RagA family TonB-linked outer membrane protein [Algoriphagus terrigena]
MAVLLILLGRLTPVSAMQSSSGISGTVLEEKSGTPVPGALILVADPKMSAITDEAGRFSLDLPAGEYELSISFIGFKTIRQTVEIQSGILRLDISLQTEEIGLEQVVVLSTGYQEIPKERATGSFAFLDQELVDRRVSTSVLDRLEDVTSGVIFNRAGAIDDQISIRGRSSLFANTQPLIVIDNLPYEGPIENINPNDVASVTVLKDAAAASIWGAQAGNGVIVITTKSGRFRQPVQVSLQSNVTVGEEPDLFYQPLMDLSDFVGQEQRLFEAGYYNARITNVSQLPVSPVVETLLAAREGRITAQEAESRLQQYSAQDSRSELRQYYYRPSIRLQNAVQVSGGGDDYRFNFSAGYDANQEEVVTNSNGRLTLNAKQDWKLLKDRLDLSTGLYLTRYSRNARTEVPNLYPYEALTDSQGNPMPVVASLNTRFVESTLDSDLLDWRFIPLNELGAGDNQTQATDWRANLGISYQLARGLKAQVLYQYWSNATELRDIESMDLFSVRHQINSFTQIREDGGLQLPIPAGSRFTNRTAQSSSHNLRANLTYNLSKKDHELNALAGWELRDIQSVSDQMGYYGYDDQKGLSTPVDFITQFRQYQNPGNLQTIPYQGSHTGNVDRFVSYFGNAAYTYRGRYTVSASARKDMSNLFGVETNQRGVPLWSSGIGWTISEENFYSWERMPYLKARLSYGYNGNVDKTTTAFTTLLYQNYHPYVSGLRSAYITNPPNPLLRWEKIRIFNVGLDFENRSGRLGGTLEYYSKRGKDLIGESEVPDSNGIYVVRGNFSETQTRGFDLILNSVNILQPIRWSSQLLLSGLKNEVIRFEGARTASQYMGAAGNVVPLEGRPLFAVYSYPWGGLDPDTGNPLGFLDGELSEDYAGIISAATPNTIQFHGSARPTVFGSLRNTLEWKGWNLSMNISFRLGYYYRRRSVDYTALSRGEISHADYGDRWLSPGDEQITQIPSQPAALNTLRHNFYQSSSLLVEKGDHIRFQDIRLGYTWSKDNSPRLPFQRMEVFSYLNNLGILWKATGDTQDPDYPGMRPLRTAAFGIRVNF